MFGYKIILSKHCIHHHEQGIRKPAKSLKSCLSTIETFWEGGKRICITFLRFLCKRRIRKDVKYSPHPLSCTQTLSTVEGSKTKKTNLEEHQRERAICSKCTQSCVPFFLVSHSSLVHIYSYLFLSRVVPSISKNFNLRLILQYIACVQVCPF